MPFCLVLLNGFAKIIEIGGYMKITYITGNKDKVAVAKLFLEPLGFEIDNRKIDCPEIQADDFESIAKFSSKYASDLLGCATLKNDSGLVVPALKGFPGPYTHYAEDTIGEDGLLKLMEGVENREAYYVECLCYTEPGKEPVCFSTKTYGAIALEKSGEYGWSWDFVFIPKGKDKPMACYPDDERYAMWGRDAYMQLAQYLKNLK